MDFWMHKVNELLICSICLERFKEPKILPCHHSFCQNCIQRIINDGKISCPTCRSIHDASNGLQNDFRTNQLLDSHNTEFFSKTPLQPSAPLLENTFSQNLSQHHHQEIGVKKRKNKQSIINAFILSIGIILLVSIIILIISFFAQTEKCKSTQFRNDKKCIDKRHYTDKCEASFQCSNLQSLSCINNTCTCFETYSYFDFDLAKCKSKLHEGAYCTASYKCLSPMLCLSNLCQCESDKYFHEPTLQCLTKLSYKAPCLSSNTCRKDIGLQCIENKCECNSKAQFWSNKKEKCENFYAYGKIGCSSDSNCDGNLICNLNPIENNCSCPKPSQYGMCDCKINQSEDFHWNGTTCVHSLGIFSKCNFDYQCKKPNICLDKISLCSPDSIFSSLLRNSAINTKINVFNFALSMLLIFFLLKKTN